MSHDSAPVYEKAPTFDEVVEYAIRNNMYGKISLVKFYDYYKPFKGPGGYIIDWKSKMFQWAQSQKNKVIISAREYEAYNRIKNGKAVPEEKIKKLSYLDDLWKKVDLI